MIFIQRQDNKTQVHHETIYVVSSVLYPSAFLKYTHIFFCFNKTHEISTKTTTTAKKQQLKESFKNCAVGPMFLNINKCSLFQFQ